jgi:hypothetical protein
MSDKNTSCCGAPDPHEAVTDQTKPAKTTNQAVVERAAGLESTSPELRNSGLFQAVRRLFTRPQA